MFRQNFAAFFARVSEKFRLNAFFFDSLQWRVSRGRVSSLALEASRQSMLNFRVGFLSLIGGRLPYPCLPNFPEYFPHLFLSHFEPKTSHNARFWGPNTLVFWGHQAPTIWANKKEVSNWPQKVTDPIFVNPPPEGLLNNAKVFPQFHLGGGEVGT